MSPPVEPSGVGTPDSGWQQSGRHGRAAAARVSTTSAETPAGTQANPQHGSRTVVLTSSAQSGLPTPAQYDSYNNQLQEQMTALAEQIAALTAAVMAGQRASAAEVRTPSPSPPWTAATLPAAPTAPPAPPTPAPRATAATHPSGSAATYAGGPADADAAWRRAPLRAQRARLLRRHGGRAPLAGNRAPRHRQGAKGQPRPHHHGHGPAGVDQPPTHARHQHAVLPGHVARGAHHAAGRGGRAFGVAPGHQPRGRQRGPRLPGQGLQQRQELLQWVWRGPGALQQRPCSPRSLQGHVQRHHWPRATPGGADDARPRPLHHGHGGCKDPQERIPDALPPATPSCRVSS